MAGVRVIMTRYDLSDVRLVERLFVDATYWRFITNDNLQTLQLGAPASANKAAKIIAEFPAGGIESVEYV